MTNPTQPLTAEEALKEIYNACDYGDSHGKSAAEWLEAYAAQQNAEMVATISQLNSDIAGLKSQMKDAEINFKALADGTIRDEAIGMLRAENERLKQQVAASENRYQHLIKAASKHALYHTEPTTLPKPPKEAT